MKTYASTATTILATLMSAACTQTPSTLPAEEHTSEVSPLGPAINKWPTVDIPVCFLTSSDFVGPPLTRTWIRYYVQNSWGRLGGITFSNWGDCNGSALHSIVVRLFHTCGIGSFGEANALGYNANGDSEVLLCDHGDLSDGTVVYLDESHTALNSIHEFGHLLGYDHENSTPSIMSSNVSTLSTILHSGHIFPTPSDIVKFQQDYGRKPDGTVITGGNNCLDVQFGSLVPGEPVFSWPCNYFRASENWLFYTFLGELMASGGDSPEYLLEVPNAEYFAGQTLDINRPASGDYQHQVFELTGEIRGPGDFCLDRQWNSYAPGTPVWMWPCDGNDAQQWVRWRAPDPGRISTLDRSMCLDSSDPSGQLYIQPCIVGNHSAQDFDLFSLQMYSSVTNTCLTGAPSQSTVVSLTPCSTPASSDNNQQWYWSGSFHPVGSPNFCLDLNNDFFDAGNNVYLAECEGSEEQRFDWYP